MDINITIIALLSAILHPLWNAMIKRDNCPEGAFVGNGVMLVMLAGIHSLYGGYDFFTVAKIWHLLIITVLAKLVYTASLVTMLRRGDLSSYYPIARSSPAFIVLISALFLGVLYTPIVLAGITMVLVGAFWLQYRRGARLLDNPKTLALSLLAMAGTGVNSIADALAVQVVAPSVIFFLDFRFYSSKFCSFLYFFWSRKSEYTELVSMGQKTIALHKNRSDLLHFLFTNFARLPRRRRSCSCELSSPSVNSNLGDSWGDVVEGDRY